MGSPIRPKTVEAANAKSVFIYSLNNSLSGNGQEDNKMNLTDNDWDIPKQLIMELSNCSNDDVLPRNSKTVERTLKRGILERAFEILQNI